MTKERWHQLMDNDSLKLWQHEIDLGWHFCYEFDGLLVGPGMSELKYCSCLNEGHPAFKTIPPDPALGTEELPIDLNDLKL